ncbi:hypothetical protein [Rhizobium sp. BK008]|uniref:hypothetical protein n=1 Tax=Rhizobium sp. BK008 TaxID=2587094 RepID=UPI0016109840|nr:hypothetical protein [Rhizobium sp. BK008]MBB4250028.1 hypothetical protein [Rhizobium sp. BK008]
MVHKPSGRLDNMKMLRNVQALPLSAFANVAIRSKGRRIGRFAVAATAIREIDQSLLSV